MKPKSYLSSGAGWLALDGSLASRSAALIGLRIASAFGLRMQSVTLGEEPFPPPSAGSGAPGGWPARSTSPEMPPASNGYFPQAAAHALQWLGSEARLAKVPLSMRVEAGDVVTSVSKLAGGGAFLAVGRRGILHQGERGYLGHHLLGIIQNASCPLLIGGERTPPATLRSIVLADDFGPAALSASSWASHLQRALSCPVGIVNLDPEPEWSPQLTEETTYPPQSPAAQTAKGRRRSPLRGQNQSVHLILAAARENQGDLVIIGSRRPSISTPGVPSRLLDLLRACERPVLAIF